MEATRISEVQVRIEAQMQRLYSRKFVRQLGGMRLDGFALCIEAQGLPLLLCTRAFAEACGCTGGGRNGIVPNDGRCSSP